MVRSLLSASMFLAILAGAPVIQAQTMGAWYVETKTSDDSSPMYALTVNDSGNAFGQFCYAADGKCYWLIGLKTTCNPGDKYPVLANSDAGSAQLEVLCMGPLSGGNLHRYAFTDFDQIDGLVRESARVGFALPLQKDEFRVVRFNLHGAAAALSAMRSAAERQVRPTKRGTRDQK